MQYNPRYTPPPSSSLGPLPLDSPASSLSGPRASSTYCLQPGNYRVGPVAGDPPPRDLSIARGQRRSQGQDPSPSGRLAPLWRPTRPPLASTMCACRINGPGSAQHPRGPSASGTTPGLGVNAALSTASASSLPAAASPLASDVGAVPAHAQTPQQAEQGQGGAQARAAGQPAASNRPAATASAAGPGGSSLWKPNAASLGVQGAGAAGQGPSPGQPPGGAAGSGSGTRDEAMMVARTIRELLHTVSSRALLAAASALACSQ